MNCKCANISTGHEWENEETWVSPTASVQCWCFQACMPRSVMSNSLWPHGLYPARLLCPWGSSGKTTGVGCRFLLQRIFLTQGSNPPLLLLLRWQADSLPALQPRVVRSAVDVSGAVGIDLWHWTLTIKTSHEGASLVAQWLRAHHPCGLTVTCLQLAVTQSSGFFSPRIKESTIQCRGHRFHPRWGTKTPHAVGQLSLCTTASEPF